MRTYINAQIQMQKDSIVYIQWDRDRRTIRWHTYTQTHANARAQTRRHAPTDARKVPPPPAYQPSHSILIHPNSCYRDQKGTSHQRRRSDGYDMQRLGNMSRGWRERTARERGTGVAGSAGSVFLWAWWRVDVSARVLLVCSGRGRGKEGRRGRRKMVCVWRGERRCTLLILPFLTYTHVRWTVKVMAFRGISDFILQELFFLNHHFRSFIRDLNVFIFFFLVSWRSLSNCLTHELSQLEAIRHSANKNEKLMKVKNERENDWWYWWTVEKKSAESKIWLH